jgi:uncharacterized protein (TIGR02452 family)
MNRDSRAAMARQTLAICERGMYVGPGGASVQIGEALEHARRGTVFFDPDNWPFLKAPNPAVQTRLSVRNETTFTALSRLAHTGGHVACLNFASAKNPGGGFLSGALAQEEALACASGLYPCLLTAPRFYERHHANRSALYLHMAIFSPAVPFFRDDAGTLLDRPILASVVTAAAPNAGAVAQNEPANRRHIYETLRRRAELVLAVAQTHRVDRLVLGAWGCGVFRNDPRVVASIFADLLANQFKCAFSEVVFAVFDRSTVSPTYHAFAEKFSGVCV